MIGPVRNPRQAYGAEGREIPPMTLANMRLNGARVGEAWCQDLGCHHHGVINADHMPDSRP
jgi:hypothetical protein